MHLHHFIEEYISIITITFNETDLISTQTFTGQQYLSHCHQRHKKQFHQTKVMYYQHPYPKYLFLQKMHGCI